MLLHVDFKLAFADANQRIQKLLPELSQAFATAHKVRRDGRSQDIYNNGKISSCGE